MLCSVTGQTARHARPIAPVTYHFSILKRHSQLKPGAHSSEKGEGGGGVSATKNGAAARRLRALCKGFLHSSVKQ